MRELCQQLQGIREAFYSIWCEKKKNGFSDGQVYNVSYAKGVISHIKEVIKVSLVFKTLKSQLFVL